MYIKTLAFFVFASLASSQSLGQSCGTNDACNPGLECRDKLCVYPLHGVGEACGGLIQNPPACQPGLVCDTTGKIPDTGGICLPMTPATTVTVITTTTHLPPTTTVVTTVISSSTQVITVTTTPVAPVTLTSVITNTNTITNSPTPTKTSGVTRPTENSNANIARGSLWGGVVLGVVAWLE